MATNKEILDLGLPDPVIPPALTPEGERYGNALAGVWGRETSTTGYGTYLRRIPEATTAQVVASDVHTTLPGLVQHIQATAGTLVGPKLPIITGTPVAGQVLVEPQSDGAMRLTFAAADAVTECAYLLLAVPAALISHLEAASNPP